METTTPVKSKRNRNLLIAVVVAVLLCMCLTSSASLCAIGILLFQPDILKPPPPSAPKAAVLAESESMLDSPGIIADSNGGVHLFWYDDSTRNLIHLRKERQGKWSEPESLGLLTQPVLRSKPDGSVCVFGYDYSASSESDSGWRQLCQTGSGWSKPEPLAGPGGYISEIAPAFAPDGRLGILYRKNDVVFFDGEALSGPEDYPISPRLVIDSSGGFHAVWVGKDRGKVLCRFSGDGGITWGPLETIGEDTGPGAYIHSLELILDRKGSIHLAWQTTTGILHRVKPSGGSWGQTESVVPSEAYPTGSLAAAVDGEGRAYVFWDRFLPGYGTGASYSRQNADGSWGEPSWVVSPKSMDVLLDLTMAVDSDGRAHLVWQRIVSIENGPPEYRLEYLSIA
jgi:hypothetical protein